MRSRTNRNLKPGILLNSKFIVYLKMIFEFRMGRVGSPKVTAQTLLFEQETARKEGGIPTTRQHVRGRSWKVYIRFFIIV